MELLKDILYTILYVLITGCGVAIVGKILNFINKKIDEAQATTELVNYDTLNIIIDQVQSTVRDVVMSVQQVYVDSLKSSGEFNKEAATIAKDTAMDTAKDLINDKTAQVITEVYGSIDTFLDVTIEKFVNDLKK